jgi:hypothetical protein
MQIEEIRNKAGIIRDLFLLDKEAKVDFHTLSFSNNSSIHDRLIENLAILQLTVSDYGDRLVVDKPFHIIDEHSEVLGHIEDVDTCNLPALFFPSKPEEAIYDPQLKVFIKIDGTPASHPFYHNLSSYLILKRMLNHVSDYYIPVDKKIVLFVPGKSTFCIRVPDNHIVADRLRNSESLDKIDQLYENWKEKPLQLIFKSSLVDILEPIPETQRIIVIINNLDSFFEHVNIEYELYIVAGNYREAKNTFIEKINSLFSDYRNSLEKLSNIVLSIPVTFAGTVFALIGFSKQITTIIIVGVLIYGIINTIILFMHLFDTIRILNNLSNTITTMSMNNSVVESDLRNKSRYLRRRLIVITIISIVFLAIFLTLEVVAMSLLFKINNNNPIVIYQKHFM